MIFKCSNGHDSTMSDFCSECGLEMQAPTDLNQAVSGGATSNAHSTVRESCPVCNTDRDEPQATFCGVCGYNFVSKQTGDRIPRAVPAPPTVVKTVPTEPERVHSASVSSHIDIEVSFDESVEEAPKGVPPRKFSLYDEESLIGRRSKSIPQTVGLEGDDGVSRRHLLIIRQPNSSYIARLFDKTNGGTLNGIEMTAGVEVPLTEGDKIVLGVFTIIKVTAIR